MPTDSESPCLAFPRSTGSCVSTGAAPVVGVVTGGDGGATGGDGGATGGVTGGVGGVTGGGGCVTGGGDEVAPAGAQGW